MDTGLRVSNPTSSHLLLPHTERHRREDGSCKWGRTLRLSCKSKTQIALQGAAECEARLPSSFLHFLVFSSSILWRGWGLESRAQSSQSSDGRLRVLGLDPLEAEAEGTRGLQVGAPGKGYAQGHDSLRVHLHAGLHQPATMREQKARERNVHVVPLPRPVRISTSTLNEIQSIVSL